MADSPSSEPHERKDSSSKEEIPRRRIVNFLLGGGLLSTLGTLLLPIINFVIPPEVDEATQSNVVAAKVDELPLNSGKTFRFGSVPAVLIHTALGEYVAYSATCTHLDCTVQYRADFKHIWCACHNGHFDLTGKNISGPPPRPLESFRVDIREDEIVVSRRSGSV